MEHVLGILVEATCELFIRLPNTSEIGAYHALRVHTWLNTEEFHRNDRPFYTYYNFSSFDQNLLLFIMYQKYNRLRCLLRVKGLVICFYLGWSGSILQIRTNIIRLGSKSSLKAL